MNKILIKPAALGPATAPYNHGVRVGDLLFCAGQIGTAPGSVQLTGDVKAQTERVLENIKLILLDQKLTPANVIKATVFMTDLAHFAEMNEIYGRFFGSDFPARTTVQVAGLPRGAQVEIEVIAHY
jgi:2-iminobutanoate/2-iminopropanoate deaminase